MDYIKAAWLIFDHFFLDPRIWVPSVIFGIIVWPIIYFILKREREANMKQRYVIKSGAGYFLNFGGDKTPHLTTDFVEATRFYFAEAEKIAKEMEKKGLVSEMILLKFKRYK